MPYKNTFILVSEDCVLEKSKKPVSDRKKIPQHILQYNFLTEKPYFFNHRSLIFQVYLTMESLMHESAIEKEVIKEKLFIKRQP